MKLILSSIYFLTAVSGYALGQQAASSPPKTPPTVSVDGISISVVGPAEGQKYAPRTNSEGAHISKEINSRLMGNLQDHFNNIKVAVKLNDASVVEGIKLLFEKTGQRYIIDNDIDLTRVISVQMPEVPFSTALDVLTKSGKINWSREMRVVNGNTTPAVTYRISRTPRPGAMAFVVKYPSSAEDGKVATVKPPAKETASSKSINYNWKYCPLCGKKIDLRQRSSIVIDPLSGVNG